MSAKVVVLDGVLNVLSNLEKVAKRMPAVTTKAIQAEAQVIMAESVRQCPVDTGRLRQSSYVKRKDEHVVIGYGVDYALAVHERTEVHHADGTNAKFLSRPVDAHRHTFVSDVANRIRATDEEAFEMAKEALGGE